MQTGISLSPNFTVCQVLFYMLSHMISNCLALLRGRYYGPQVTNGILKGPMLWQGKIPFYDPTPLLFIQVN